MPELFNRGFLPATIRAQHDDWFKFVQAEGDLTSEETAALQEVGPWFRMLELTALNKSYKMVVLRVLVDMDAFWNGMEIRPLADACRAYLLEHPQLRLTFNRRMRYPTTGVRPQNSGPHGGFGGHWTGGSTSNRGASGSGARANVLSSRFRARTTRERLLKA
jgi:hypothetical protein